MPITNEDLHALRGRYILKHAAQAPLTMLRCALLDLLVSAGSAASSGTPERLALVHGVGSDATVGTVARNFELLQKADFGPKTGAQLCVIAEPAQMNSWQPLGCSKTGMQIAKGPQRAEPPPIGHTHK